MRSILRSVGLRVSVMLVVGRMSSSTPEHEAYRVCVPQPAGRLMPMQGECPHSPLRRAGWCRLFSLRPHGRVILNELYETSNDGTSEPVLGD